MEAFHPPALLKNRHVQTILSSTRLRRVLAFRRAQDMLNASRSHILDCGEGVRLQGYYAAANRGGSRLCILIHGWEGSADSSYLVSAAGYLWNRGFDLFRLNLRDHGQTHHLNPGIFHSCRINEVVGAVKRIQEVFPHERLFLGGFSLGGNFALRVAVRAPAAGIRLDGVVAVCPVLNPESTLTAMETGPALYHAYFMKKWRNSLKIKHQAFPHSIDIKEVSRYKSIRALTEYFVHQHTEFPNITAYLNGYAIIGDILKELEIPSLIISSLDDPVIPAEDLKKLAPPKPLRIETPANGGHCGFLEDFRFTSWANRRMAEGFAEF